MSPVQLTHSKTLSAFFKRKKATILSELDRGNYSDKSPKGSVDAEIVDLIREINEFEVYVTTSSCAGRVAVFVEGHKAGTAKDDFSSDFVDGEALEILGDEERRGVAKARPNIDVGIASNVGNTSGPGGKGFGNKWLFVSHSPIPDEHVSSTSTTTLHELFQCLPGCTISPLSTPPKGRGLRLVKLSFSPLILHVLCADLHAAKPLLAAAINAGFRESGVQSLKALEDEDAGVMLAIRTAGLGFETVIGVVEEEQQSKADSAEDGADTRGEIYRSLVSEDYLKLCVDVVNERFDWNVKRRERLRSELDKLRSTKALKQQWEDRDQRRRRKQQEGLERRKKLARDENSSKEASDNGQDALDGGLDFEKG